MMIATRPGPWIPSVSVSSISAVRLGPVMKVQDVEDSNAIPMVVKILAHAETEIIWRDHRDMKRRQQRNDA